MIVELLTVFEMRAFWDIAIEVVRWLELILQVNSLPFPLLLVNLYMIGRIRTMTGRSQGSSQ